MDEIYKTITVWLEVLTMDEGRERDKTSRGGGLPMLPGLYHSTFQPSQRGFFWVHMSVWRERKIEAEFLNFLGPRNLFLKGTVALDDFFCSFDPICNFYIHMEAELIP